MSNSLDLRDRFLTIFRTTITRQGADELLAWLQDSDFCYAPASTRYHGSHEGGLLEHSLNVFDVLVDLVEGWGFSDQFSAETLAICALLHDVCKINCYKVGTRNVKENGQWVTKEVYEFDEKFPCGDHADKSVIILQNFIRLEPEEILAIRAHMGAFDSAAKGGSQVINRIFERSKLAVLLHMADMQATYLLEA